MADLCFTTDRKSEPVILTTGEERRAYVLKEFDGEARQKYMGSVLQAVDIDLDADAISKAGDDEEKAKEAVKVKSLNSQDLVTIQVDLVSLCLYEKDAVETVPKEFVSGLPVATIDGLYAACQILNALGVKANETAKNV